MIYTLSAALRGGPSLRVAMGAQHSLGQLYACMAPSLGLSGHGVSVYMSWPGMEDALGEGHPTLDLPLGELGLEVRQGLVMTPEPRTRINLFLEDIGPGPGPAAPELLACTPFALPSTIALGRRLRAMRVPPPPRGLPAPALAALTEALEALHELDERRFGRRPGPAPDEQSLGLATLHAAGAWAELLASAPTPEQLERLRVYLGVRYRPPESLLRQVLGWSWTPGVPAHAEEVIAQLSEGLRPFQGEWVVRVQARGLIRQGKPQQAVSLLLAHSSGPQGPCSVLEEIVDAAEALVEAGAVDAGAERLAVVARRVWGQETQRLRARTRLEGLLSEAGLREQRAAWEQADRRRARLLDGP